MNKIAKCVVALSATVVLLSIAAATPCNEEWPFYTKKPPLDNGEGCMQTPCSYWEYDGECGECRLNTYNPNRDRRCLAFEDDYTVNNIHRVNGTCYGTILRFCAGGQPSGEPVEVNCDTAWDESCQPPA